MLPSIIALVCLVFSSSASASIASEPRPGRVVLAAGDVRLPPEQARGLGGETRVQIRLKDTPPGSDPMSALEARATTFVIDLALAFPGDDRALCERVENAPCIVLSGGSWVDWYVLFKPGKKSSGFARALARAHRSGATIVGQDAAANYLADFAPLERVALQRPIRNPHQAFLDVLAQGPHLVEGISVDLALDVRVSPARLVSTVAHRGLAIAVWLDGSVAWIWDPVTKSAEISGTGAAFVFDLSSARRSRRSFSNARVSLVRAGETFDLRRRAIVPAPAVPARVPPKITFGKLMLEREFTRQRVVDGDYELTFDTDDASVWNGTAWTKLLLALEPRER